MQVKSKMGQYRPQLGNKELKRKLGNNDNLLKIRRQIILKSKQTRKWNWVFGQIGRQIDFS